MWGGRRKEEDYPPRPAAAAPAAVPVPEPISKEGNTLMSSTPSRMYEPETPRSAAATIGKSVVIKGQIYSREDLYLDGEVEGTIDCQESKVTIGPHGRIQAAVKAREVVVLGAVQGNVDAADKIDIRKDAKLVGDIKTARIVIEDGAFFKGSIDITRPEGGKVEKAAARPAASSQGQPASMATGAGDARR
jgi:cytoskeletal protein CcmA (bactofilin family)